MTLFRRTRWRLALLYTTILTAVLGIFSLAFYVAFAHVLAPDAEVNADDLTYAATVARIGLALLAADGIAVLAFAVAGWILAGRSLRPLEEAHRRQGRFVADASHELRTPLAAARAAAEAGAMGPEDPAALRAALQATIERLDRLGRLLDNLLVLARVEGRAVPIAEEAVDASLVAAEAAATFAAAHPDLPPPRLRLTPDLFVRASLPLLERAIANLLDNAYRYGYRPADPAPTVETRRERGGVVLEVSDDGPGIPDPERMVEAFTRGRADARAPDGVGLGLAITREIAKLHHGELVVVPRSQGTTIRLVLPAARAPSHGPRALSHGVG